MNLPLGYRYASTYAGIRAANFCDARSDELTNACAGVGCDIFQQCRIVPLHVFDSCGTKNVSRRFEACDLSTPTLDQFLDPAGQKRYLSSSMHPWSPIWNHRFEAEVAFAAAFSA